MTQPDSNVIPLHVTRWKCPHCSKSWASKWRATRHVAMCWHNPANRSCKTCTHRIEADSEYGYTTDEDCGAGVEMERDPVTPQLAVFPLHCPKWESSHDTP